MPSDRRAALRQKAGPRANSPRGYPYPLRSWPPDTAMDIQNLAVAIDADVTKQTHFAVARLTADSPAQAAGAVDYPMSVVRRSNGTSLTLVSGWLQVAAGAGGGYMIGGNANFGSIAAGEFSTFLQVYRASAGLESVILGGSSLAHLLASFAGSSIIVLQPNDQIKLGAYATGAGYKFRAGTEVWAQRLW